MNILHLEMSQFFSRVIGKVAGEAGYQYRNERSIEAGLAAMNDWTFDLLITGHILEDGRAEDLCRRITGIAGKPGIRQVVPALHAKNIFMLKQAFATHLADIGVYQRKEIH